MLGIEHAGLYPSEILSVAVAGKELRNVALPVLRNAVF